jgi:hypothetical protein
LGCNSIADNDGRDLVELPPVCSGILARALDGRCFGKHNDDFWTAQVPSIQYPVKNPKCLSVLNSAVWFQHPDKMTRGPQSHSIVPLFAALRSGFVSNRCTNVINVCPVINRNHQFNSK